MRWKTIKVTIIIIMVIIFSPSEFSLLVICERFKVVKWGKTPRVPLPLPFCLQISRSPVLRWTPAARPEKSARRSLKSSWGSWKPSSPTTTTWPDSAVMRSPSTWTSQSGRYAMTSSGRNRGGAISVPPYYPLIYQYWNILYMKWPINSKRLTLRWKN